MWRIYPAVDIKGGKCVRLFQGDPCRETVYSPSPLEMALTWEGQGATFLHVVDLDGAVQESLVNLEIERAILSQVSIPVQIGGGIRSKEDIELLLSMGAERVILGTTVFTEAGFVEEMIGTFGWQVIVSLDTWGRKLGVSGWTRVGEWSFDEVLGRLRQCGAERFILTDIMRDGTLKGYNTEALEPFLDQGLGIIAAGGVSSIEDLLKLKALSSRGLEGVIIGKALYNGDLELADILDMEED